MITTKLIGGMGNQLFQYALGRGVAARLGTQSQMDITGYENQTGIATPRAYALAVFNIQERFAPRGAAAGRTLSHSLWARLMRRVARRFAKPEPGSYVERTHAFDPGVFDVADGTAFSGYWQTEKYFCHIGDEIRREFTLRPEYSVEQTPVAQAIRSGASVSLHVRRGDYVSHAGTNAFHGTCTPEYYAAAVRLVAGRVAEPHFYVFSDDIEWVKANLPLAYPVTYVSDGALKDYEELALMSYCKHNIIANSSFSWWGAWLNSNPDKVVIAPRRWFAGSDKDTSDMIPETWTKI